MANPFAAFSIHVVGSKPEVSPSVSLGHAVRSLPLEKATPNSGKLMLLDELPLAENEAGGYQYRTAVRVLGKNVETMLDGCAGSNHVTEELVVGQSSQGVAWDPPPPRDARLSRPSRR